MATLREKFLEFHSENPHVYEEFSALAKQTRERGFECYSASGIIHLLRWHKPFRTSGSDYKLNSGFAAFYARMFVRDNPDYDGFFYLKGSIADQEPLP